MFNDFSPDSDKEFEVPYFDDVTADAGWEGHSTSKSIDTLQSEISANMSRLNCVVTGFVSGKFGDRPGYQIHFAIKATEGKLALSRLDIACLPLNPKKKSRFRGDEDPRLLKTRKMALYMVNKAFKGMFFLQALAPSFIPFMSLMLDAKNNTLGQVWQQAGKLSKLLPMDQGETFIEGEVTDA